MVKLTTKYLFRRMSKKNQVQLRRKNETDLDFLNRITHLHLQSQFIDKIAPISECESVKVLYLQNNLLLKIENMDNFPKLTHLYLQHNYISKLDNLKPLVSLKKLYLGWNEITVVEGLEPLTNLTELHLENQRLPQGETLYFDPSTVSHLGRRLKVLNISNNNIVSIAPLSGLTSLKRLLIDGNRIDNLEEFLKCLSAMPMLEELSSEGNPIASDRRYLDSVIVASTSLGFLNGKPIKDQTRLFVTGMNNNRIYRQRLSALSTRALDSEEGFPSCWGDECSRSGRPQMGSKLFPVLKSLAKDNETVVRLPGKMSANSLSPVFQNSVKVSSLITPTASSYY